MTPEPHDQGAMSWMARNSVAANLLMMVFLIGGLILAFQIKQEFLPDITLDTIMVTVPFPAATPEDVEEGILLSIEEEVRGLDAVKRVTASAYENSASVAVELELGANKDKALQDVKGAVDRITSFPQDAERPIVSMPTVQRSAISFLLYGDIPEPALRQLAEQVRDELLANPRLTVVTLSGVRAPEISVEVPQAKLREYNLTLPEIADRIRTTALDLPGGEVKTESGKVLLRLSERRDLAREFQDLPVLSLPGGGVVRLRDVGAVRDGFEDNEIEAFFNGKPAVLVNVFRVADQTPIEVANIVYQYLEDLRRNLPPGIGADIWEDFADVYRQRRTLLLRNAMLGLILVLIILGMFLEVRLAFWVMMGIPVSFLGALMLLPALDVSINMMSLFAFIMALGIVVDDAIVVGENIYEMRRQGGPYIDAATSGARGVAMPVVFSVLTNMIAFLPLLFIPGPFGKLFAVIPLVTVTVFAISLVESLLILPAHLGHQRKTGPRGVLGFCVKILSLIEYLPQRFCRWLLREFTQRAYAPLLRRLLGFRYAVIAVGVAILVFVVVCMQTGRIRVTRLPKVEADIVRVTALLAYGSPVKEAHRVQQLIQHQALDLLHKKYGGEKMTRGIFALIGRQLAGHGPGSAMSRPDLSAGSHIVNVQIFLEPDGIRTFSTQDFTRDLRRAVGDIPGIESLTFKAEMGPSGGAAIDVELTHRDTETLERAARDLAERLKTFTGTKEIDDGFSLGKPQYEFVLRPEGRSLNLTSASVGRQMRAAFYGAEALRQQRGRDEVKVMVRLPEAERISEYNLHTLMLRTPNGGEIRLSDAARAVRTHSYTVIHRVDGRRVLNITAEVEQETDTNTIIPVLQAEVLPELMRAYPGLNYEMGGEEREYTELMIALGRGFAVALIVIFGMLAVPLKSYVQPLIIMTAIPFGIVGAVLGHVIMGYSVNFMTMLGLVALSGVVVNDSLVLIHAINTHRGEGMSPFEAVIQAGMRRFRPIILTSVTTFGGLAPMIFETSFQAKMLIPMAIALGYGVLFATAITLVLIPALYLVTEDLKRIMNWLFETGS